jgi:hypothetical protein
MLVPISDGDNIEDWEVVSLLIALQTLVSESPACKLTPALSREGVIVCSSSCLDCCLENMSVQITELLVVPATGVIFV